MHPLDTVLQRVCPCVMCPRHEPFAPLAAVGHRFIAAQDGLHIEIRRPWLHALLKVAHSPVPLPYGQPPLTFSVALHERSLVDGLRRFIEHARAAAPLEHAAWLIADPASSTVRYVEPEMLARNTRRVQYLRPDAAPDRLPVVDCHSHGKGAAYFSPQDDADDLPDDAKLAFVAGNLDTPRPTIAMRLVGLGLSLDVSQWASELLHAHGVVTAKAAA